MTHRSPLVTLIGLVAAFAIMFGTNAAGSDAGGAGATPSAGATGSAAAPLPSASSAPPTSAPPSPSTNATASASPSASPSAGDRFPDQAVYAGRSKDRSVAIAVATLGTEAAAYLCDGESLESWLRGRVDGDTVTLKNKKGTATLTATLQGGALFGAVDLDGEKLAFSLERAQSPAGLYRARGAKTTIGWIVLPDGSQVGLATTGGESAPAPELDPGNPSVVVDGEPLQGEPVTGDLDV